jgi:hypothetical protein
MDLSPVCFQVYSGDMIMIPLAEAKAKLNELVENAVLYEINEADHTVTGIRVAHFADSYLSSSRAGHFIEAGSYARLSRAAGSCR